MKFVASGAVTPGQHQVVIGFRCADEDRRQNIGTTFIVTIPVKLDETLPVAEKPVRRCADIKGKKALLVEDNELNMERSDAKTIPIIAMTANAFDEDARHCLEAGMNAHLSKPLQMDKVIATIAKFFGASK